MGRCLDQIYIHLVWSTWKRSPIIDASFERDLHRYLHAEVVKLGGGALAISGTADHVHLLVRVPASVRIPDLVKHLKGRSSYWINQGSHRPDWFRWQGYYGAFSVSRWDVERVTRYIVHQKTHHAQGTLYPDLEATMPEQDLPRTLAQQVVAPTHEPMANPPGPDPRVGECRHPAAGPKR